MMKQLSASPASLIEFVQQLKKSGASEKEFSKKIGHFLEMKARERAIPISGCFELTPLCNLDCKMCYVHLSNTSFNQKDLLSTEKWKELMKQAYEAGMVDATLTGGECLSYPGFDDLFLFLHEKGVGINLLSNGILIDEKRVDFFKRYMPKCIKITLYGSSDDAYAKVTGHRVFNKVFHNICLIRDAGLPIYVSITPSRFMADDFHQLIEKAESLNIPYQINAKLFPPRENTGRDVEDLSLDQYVELYRIRAKYAHRDLVPNDLSELPIESRSGISRTGLLCGAGRSSFAIKYDGSMCPCVSLDEFSVPVLDGGFMNAWKIIHEYAMNYPIPCECINCAYFPVCLQCAAMHKGAPSPGHCDPRICVRTKRIAQEGFLTYHKTV